MHRALAELKFVHRVERQAFDVVTELAARLLKQFVEEELHHQERGAEIETIFAKAHFCITPPDDRLLLKHFDIHTAVGQQHRGGKSAGASTYHNCLSSSSHHHSLVVCGNPRLLPLAV